MIIKNKGKSMEESTLNAKKQRRWKNLLLIPGFQIKIVLFVFLAGMVCMSLNAYLYYTYIVESYGFIFRYSKLPQELIDSRYSDLFAFGVSLGAITIVVLLMVAIWILVMTHRAAGSIYHMKKVVDEIKAGNTGARVHLREKDYFQDFAASLNQLIATIDKNPVPKH